MSLHERQHIESTEKESKYKRSDFSINLITFLIGETIKFIFHGRFHDIYIYIRIGNFHVIIQVGETRRDSFFIIFFGEKFGVEIYYFNGVVF